MNRKGIIVLGLIMVGLLTACAAKEADEGVYEGFLAFGFESSVFVPCGSAENWWVIPNQQASDQYSAVSQQPYEPVFARLQGDVSQEGVYGHLGAYQREFKVSAVVEIRAAETGDCQ